MPDITMKGAEVRIMAEARPSDEAAFTFSRMGLAFTDRRRVRLQQLTQIAAGLLLQANGRHEQFDIRITGALRHALNRIGQRHAIRDLVRRHAEFGADGIRHLPATSATAVATGWPASRLRQTICSASGNCWDIFFMRRPATNFRPMTGASANKTAAMPMAGHSPPTNCQ